jgi:hypothetical protein
MDPQDLTLLQFLQKYELGTAFPYNDNGLIDLGCQKEEISKVEAIKFQLKREFSEGEITGLAVTYLLCLHYRDIHISQSFLENPEDGEEKILSTALISATDKDGQNRVTIDVASGPSYAQFVLSSS